MTRALFSLFSGNIAAYISQNVMALPVAMVVFGEIFQKAFEKKKLLHSVSVTILAINFLYYAKRFIL